MRGTGQQIQVHRIGGKTPPHQVNSFTNPDKGVEEGLAPLFLYRPLSFEGEALPLVALAQRGDRGGEVDNLPYFY